MQNQHFCLSRCTELIGRYLRVRFGFWQRCAQQAPRQFDLSNFFLHFPNTYKNNFDNFNFVMYKQTIFTYHPSPLCYQDTIQGFRFCATCSGLIPLSLKSCHCCHFCFLQSNLFFTGSGLFLLEAVNCFFFFCP